MKTRLFKLFALFLILSITVNILPAVPASAEALSVQIDSVNGSKSVSGSYIWTTGTFNATYWVAIEASYVSFNVYTAKAIYPNGTKSVTVSGTNILLVVHMDHTQYVNACKIAIGDTLTLYDINLATGSCNNGYVKVTSGTGITLSQNSSLTIDYSAKQISGIGLGSTVSALKTHIYEATDDIQVKDANGNVLGGSALLGTGYTVSSNGTDTFSLAVSGDLDGDGSGNSTDYVLLRSYLTSGTTDYKAYADANGDGAVSSLDVVALKLCLKSNSASMLPAIPAISKTEPEDVVVPPSTLNYHSKTFKLSETSGTYSGTVLSGGKLTLASGSTSGTFISDTVNVGTFKMMLGSWNAVTNGGKLSMDVSFELTTGAWSSYIGWGTWSTTSGVSASTSASNTYASVDVDILTINSGYTTTGNIKVRLTLTKYNNGTPVVENFSIATAQMADQMTVNTSALPSYYLNNVPMRSQMASENGSIGSIICSPTTTAMALEYLGTKVTSLTAAKAMYDNKWAAYGNWSFAAAYAGEHGYVAYLDFYDTDMLKYALSQGCSIGCSTSLTSSGHLVLVVGYTVINGVEYFIVNDPNVSGTSTSRTNYTVSYFESVWVKSARNNYGVVYVFQGVYDLNQR